MTLPVRRRPRWSPVAGLLLALAVLPINASVTRATSADVQANCSVNLRTSTSSSSAAVTVMSTGTVVTYSGVVSGNSWTGGCSATTSGSSWYAITAVNGQSVATQYGVSVAYAATGMFRSVDGTAVLEGVDVSRWQGAVDFAAVRSSGRQFVVAKASEGIGYLDPNYLTYKSAATTAGLKVAAYHFARPDLNGANPQGEADWFVASMGLVPGMLVPALDLEVSGTLGTAGLTAWVGAWLDRVYSKTGIRPMIYTSPSFWNKYLGDTATFADQGYSVLWVAHWFVGGPTVPAKNWGNHGWTFWQYDDCGNVPGFGGCVDLDRYNGTDLTPVTYGADFGLAVSPSSVVVGQGTGASFSLSLSRAFFTLPINLTVSGLPAGAAASFSTNHLTGNAATLSITTTGGVGSTPVGSYPITISANANGVTHQASLTLSVTSLRLAGADRYATAAAISAATFAPGVPVAYLATGLNYPDALAGAAAAGVTGGPLLLASSTLPAVTAAELARLHPGRIVVLGSTSVIPDTVMNAVAAYTNGGGVSRLSGADRYATAAAISAATFAPGVPVAYLATGLNYPDALAGAAAAGVTGGPLLLANSTLPAATAAELARLHPGRIVVLGSTSVIPDTVMNAVAAYTAGGGVSRLSGADRYATAAAISAATFAPGVPVAYLATGLNYPDALAGAAAAGVTGGPLLLANSTLPAATAAELARLHPGRIIILGSTSVIPDTVVTAALKAAN